MTGLVKEYAPLDWRAIDTDRDKVQNSFVWKLKKLQDKNYLIRAAEFRHEFNFDTKKDVWIGYIRWFPISTSQLGTLQDQSHMLSNSKVLDDPATTTGSATSLNRD